MTSDPCARSVLGVSNLARIVADDDIKLQSHGGLEDISSITAGIRSCQVQAQRHMGEVAPGLADLRKSWCKAKLILLGVHSSWIIVSS